MPNNNEHFAWAYGNNPNITTPERGLMRQGWKAGNMPMASNINWMFKQISDDLSELRKLAQTQAQELKEQRTQLKKQQEEISNLNKSHTDFKAASELRSEWVRRKFVFRKHILRKHYGTLAWMYEAIKGFHPQLPKNPWEKYKIKEIKCFFKKD